MKQFAKAVAAFSAGSAVGTFTQIAKGKLSAIALGADGVGVIAQLTNAWNFLVALSSLGLYNGVVRRVSEAKRAGDWVQVRTQLSTAIIALSLTSVTVSAVAALASAPLSAWLFAGDESKSLFVALTLVSVPLGVIAQTYRAVLSGLQQVRAIVRVQVISDLVGLALFALLIWLDDLRGAVLAFSAMHLVKALMQWRSIRKIDGFGPLLVNASHFSAGEVRPHLAYGINGLVMTSIAVGSTLLVSTWTIQSLGEAGNGIFSVAWKVASLYFGAIYASAGAYYFPVLASVENNRELGQKVNDAAKLYMFLLPPAIAALLTLGQELMIVLFSEEFVIASLVLVLLLPADIFRVLSESVGMAFLAKRRLWPYTTSYLVWAVTFAGLSYSLLPIYGVAGIGLAYLVSQLINFQVVSKIARNYFGFAMDPSCIRAMFAGLLLVTACGVSVCLLDGLIARTTVFAVFMSCWFAIVWRDASFQGLVSAGLRRMHGFVR